MKKGIKKQSVSRLTTPLTILMVLGISLGIISGWVNALLPTIHTVDPNSGSDEGGETVTITGEDFTKIADFRPESIFTKGAHTCAITLETKQAYCWGHNWQGQLGYGTQSDSSIPVAVDTSGVLNGKTIEQIVTGRNHTCALSTDGQAYCWGNNGTGQLGNGGTSGSLVPVAVDTSGVLNGKTIKQITTGCGTHVCVVTTDGQAYCWGANWSGQLGNSDTAHSNIPVAVNTGGVLTNKTIKQISAGINHTCVLASDDLVYCWGSNDNGQLGDGTGVDSLAPVAVDTSGVLNGKTIKQVMAGTNYTCVIASDDQAYCWGANGDGQLGNGNSNNSLAPVAVDTSGVLNGKTIKQFGTGAWHNSVVTTDGQAYCWGRNDSGQIGDGNTYEHSLIPVAVNTSGVLAGKTVVQISGSHHHTCAATSDDRVYCWGANWPGQLGDGSNDPSLVPIAVNTSGLPVVPNVQSVLFGTVPAASFVIDSATQLTAITPAHPAGLVDVTLFNAKNQPVVLTGGYTFTGKPTTPQAPGTGVNGKDELMLISSILATMGLSLVVYYRTNKKPKWFGK